MADTFSAGIINYYYSYPPDVPVKTPYRISAIYTDDLDIISIHNFVLQKFEIMLYSGQDSKENITNKCLKYKEEVIPYLDIYYKLSRKPKVISFATKKINEKDPNQEDDKIQMRVRAIKCFLALCEKYIVVDVLHDVDTSDPNCPKCQILLDDDGSGLQICEHCGYEKIGFNITENMSDQRNNYLDRENFVKALSKYQGKIVPDKDVVDDVTKLLDIYFTSYGMEPGELIRKKPLNKRNRKDGTSKELMYQALSEINRPLYDFANYFCYVYWGWVLPDISHLEAQILQHYDMTQIVLDSLHKTRKSSLNTQFRLLKHLELVGYPCSIDDFRIIKTRTIIEEHDELWGKMCEGAGLKFVRTI